MLQRKLLVVEDDELMCWALEKEFAGTDYEIRVVESREGALSELRNGNFDIVFLDIRLPDGDGIDILPDIGRISPDTRTIVMSGNATEKNRQRAFERGAVKFLEKPFDLSDVHAILRDALAGRLRKREHPRSACRVPLRITILKPAAEDDRYSLACLGATMSDVSLGGFKVRTKYALSVGQNIRAHVDAAGDEHSGKYFSPDATAEVVWVSPAHDSITAGLKFTA